MLAELVVKVLLGFDRMFEQFKGSEELDLASFAHCH